MVNRVNKVNMVNHVSRISRVDVIDRFVMRELTSSRKGNNFGKA